MKLIIDNIHPEMWAHMVNAFKGDPHAYQTLSMDEQQELVGAHLVDMATQDAKRFAVQQAQIQAGQQVGALADALVQQTKETVEFSVEAT